MGLRGAVADAARLARMTGTSVAGPGSALWVTDFLNAAYFRRRAGARDVADLRLAFAILCTAWHRSGRRLGARDLPAFHRAFGRGRLSRPSGLGTLDRHDLLSGGDRLLGAGFAADHEARRRAWGVVFPDEEARRRYVPESRLARGALGPPTPPRQPPERQTWSVYRPVELADAESSIARLLTPEGWPDHGSTLGRFTPVRPGGLPGQTFEIEIIGQPAPFAPLVARGYVSVEEVSTGADPAALARRVDLLEAGLAAAGAPAALPPGAEPLLLVELATHRGHFLGSARSRVLAFRAGGAAHLRAIGSWDPMSWPIGPAYRMGGATAQHAFWGEGAKEASMLHQFAAPPR